MTKLLLSDGATREICKLCYSVNAIGFDVPDSVWNAVVPGHVVNRVVCLRCFTRLADEKFVHWDGAIQFFPVSLATHLNMREQEASLVDMDSIGRE